MSGDLFSILSYLPESDLEQQDNQIVDFIIGFLSVLSMNIISSGCVTSDLMEKLDKIFNKIKDTKVLDVLYFLLQQYTNIHNYIRISAIIGNFLCGQEIPFKLWTNVSIMKEGLELYVNKKEGGKESVEKKKKKREKLNREEEEDVSSDDIKLILISLARISMIDLNRERMIENKFVPLLLKIINGDDFILIQYAVVPLGNLSFTFSNDCSRRLIEEHGLFDIFSKLFEQLTLITSTLPVPYFALCSCFLVICNVLKTYPPSSDELLKNQLIKTSLNMLMVASSLIICSPISSEIKLFFNRVCLVLVYSGVSQENVETLFEIGAVSLVVNCLEDLTIERKKSENKDYDEILESLTNVLYDLVVKGFNIPTSSNENSLFNKFDKINAAKKFSDIFSILKSMSSSSRDIKACLNYLSLSVCRLYRGKIPPPFSGAVLEHCYGLINSPSSLMGYDFTKFAHKSWENMKDADKILEGYEKKLDSSPLSIVSSSAIIHSSTSSISPPDLFK
jgi:hypothetical protein